MSRLNVKFFALIFGLSIGVSAVGEQLQMGKAASPIKLENGDGERVNGGAWSSEETKGFVTTFFYIDPDERVSNEPLEAAFKKEKFPLDKFKSVAVINLGATWIPNGIINSKLKDKQKEFSHTVYVKDFKKKIVEWWGLADDSVNVVVFDKEGKVAFMKKGALNAEEISSLMAQMREWLK